MPVENGSFKIVDSTSNPAPLGLLGFGMTTVLLNLHNAGLYPLDSMILAMGLFYGGSAQFVAGIMEWKKNNTFGTTAFMSYGAFWLTLVALILLPKMTFLGVGDQGVLAPTATSFAAYLAVWGVFTAAMFIGTLKLNRALQFVFGSLVILFFLLAYGKATGNAAVIQIAGYEGIVCGASAIYTGLAQVLNEVYGKVVWPIFPVQK